MNTQQNNPLTLADRLIDEADIMDMGRPPVDSNVKRQAATELRRLHALQQEMIDTLKIAEQFMFIASDHNLDEVEIGGEWLYELITNVRNMINKAESK